MPFFKNSDGVEVNGGQMNEVAGDFYSRVGHKADGDQYFGTGNTSTRRRPGGSLSVGLNSGLVNVDTNSGLLDVGTITPKGRLEVTYNGPHGPRPNNDTTTWNRNVRILGTPQGKSGEFMEQRPKGSGRGLCVVSGHGVDHAAVVEPKSDALLRLDQDDQPSQKDIKSESLDLRLPTTDEKGVTETHEFSDRKGTPLLPQIYGAPPTTFVGHVQQALHAAMATIINVSLPPLIMMVLDYGGRLVAWVPSLFS